jgi:hypothetical protein
MIVFVRPLDVSPHPDQLGCAKRGRKPASPNGDIGLPELLPCDLPGAQLTYLEALFAVMQVSAQSQACGKGLE